MEENTDYENTLDMAEAGHHTEALENIRLHLAEYPDDAEALNDAGVILHCIGHSDQALGHLLRARQLAPGSGEIVWNLVETCLAAGKPHDAELLFDDMEKMQILSADVLNRTATVFINNDDAASALRILRRSLEFAPQQEILKPMIETLEKV